MIHLIIQSYRPTTSIIWLTLKAYALCFLIITSNSEINAKLFTYIYHFQQPRPAGTKLRALCPHVRALVYVLACYLFSLYRIQDYFLATVIHNFFVNCSAFYVIFLAYCPCKYIRASKTQLSSVGSLFPYTPHRSETLQV